MLENSPRAPSGNRDYLAEIDLIRNSKRFKYCSKLPDDAEVGRPLTLLWRRTRAPFGYCAGIPCVYDVPYGDDMLREEPRPNEKRTHCLDAF